MHALEQPPNNFAKDATIAKDVRPRGYQSLIAWQRAMDSIDCGYAFTRKWPSHELYGLTNQFRRCLVSIAANIAEGQGRLNDGDFARFLSIAHGSTREAETLVLISSRQGYTTPEEEARVLASLQETGRLIQGLHKMVESRRRH